MNCPHCNKALPDNYSAATCCDCGRELTLNSSASRPPVKIKWIWFWLALMAPPLLTLLSAHFMHSTSSAANEGLSPAIALLGGGAGGLACGILLGIKLGKTSGARVGYAILFGPAMIFVSVLLCFFGCNVGGYHFDIK